MLPFAKEFVQEAEHAVPDTGTSHLSLTSGSVIAEQKQSSACVKPLSSDASSACCDPERHPSESAWSDSGVEWRECGEPRMLT